MSNFDRAVKVLDSQGAYCGQCSHEPGDSLDACRDCATVLETYAHALEAAGLLAPDLPEPGLPGLWEVDGLAINLVDKDGDVCIEWEADSDYIYGTHIRTLWLNRDQVLAILAAADYTEKGQGNGHE